MNNKMEWLGVYEWDKLKVVVKKIKEDKIKFGEE
jgi:hypothetical protein